MYSHKRVLVALDDSTAHEILVAAKESGADLIAMATHGRTEAAAAAREGSAR